MAKISKIQYDTNALASSMVIKHHLLAVSVNINMRTRYPEIIIDNEDMSTWPLYINMTGNPHAYNNTIYINRLDSNEKIELTRTVLDNNPEILRELRLMSTYYNELLAVYPGDGSYIHGMIYPVNMSDILNAPEGKILNYNEDFVLWNETNLIVELETSIMNWLHRWTVPEYIMTDSLFASALSTKLLQFIISKIYSLRIQRIKTYEVNEIYIQHKLNSAFGIGRFTKTLSNASKLWLYKNIDYIGYNVGKDSTIDLLVDKVVAPSGITVDEVRLLPTNVTIQSIQTPETPLFIKDKNPLYMISRMGDGETNTMGFDTLAQLEGKTIIPELREFYVDNVGLLLEQEQQLKATNGKIERSKDLILSLSKKYISSPLPRDYILLEVALLILGKYDTTRLFTYTSPINHVEYVYSGEKLLVLLIGAILKMLNYTDDTVISTLKVSNLFKPTDTGDLLDNIEPLDLDGNEIFISVINEINSKLSSVLSPNMSQQDIHSYILENMDARYMLYLFKYSVDNGAWSSAVNIIDDRFRLREDIDIPVEYNTVPFMEYIDGLYVSIPDEGLMEIIDEIVYTITGERILRSILDEQKLENMKEILNRLTSYTVQFLTSDVKWDNIISRPGLDPLYDADIVDIHAAEYDCEGATTEVESAYGDDSRVPITVYYKPGLTISRTLNRKIPVITTEYMEDRIHINTRPKLTMSLG